MNIPWLTIAANRVRIGLFVSAAAALGGCGSDASAPAGQDGWHRGDPQRKFDVAAKHLRGLDVAMIEVDHRYTELYWAGQDQN